MHRCKEGKMMIEEKNKRIKLPLFLLKRSKVRWYHHQRVLAIIQLPKSNLLEDNPKVNHPVKTINKEILNSNHLQRIFNKMMTLATLS
jgi:hypothetical protein